MQRVIRIEPKDEDIVLRLVTALIEEWDRLPDGVRAALMREACLTMRPEGQPTTSLAADIKAFIRQHKEADDASRS